jgi:uncharacterized protein YbaP (TraB family)
MRRAVLALLLAASAFGQGTSVVALPGSAAPSTGLKEPEWRAAPAPSNRAAAAVAAPRGLRHGLFWKATSATNTVYLLGSIHVGTEELYPLPKQIEAAFRSAGVLVVEINLNKLDAKRLQTLVARGCYPPGDSLWRHISAEGKQAVLRFCARHNVAPGFFAPLKPWMAILVASSFQTLSNGMSAQLGIDRHFLNRVSRGIRVEEIETMEQQMHLFVEIAGDDPERVLLQALQSAESDGNVVMDLQDAWVAGDADKLEELVRSMYTSAPEVAEKLIGRRNLRMAEVVERHLNGRETAFVVVGAAHMVGENGVVRLLEEKGYHVEQIFSQMPPR